jgi:hypothetical protein
VEQDDTADVLPNRLVAVEQKLQRKNTSDYSNFGFTSGNLSGNVCSA